MRIARLASSARSHEKDFRVKQIVRWEYLHRGRGKWTKKKQQMKKEKKQKLLFGSGRRALGTSEWNVYDETEKKQI